MDVFKLHEARIERLKQEVAQLRQYGDRTSSPGLVHKKNSSNTTNKKNYPKAKASCDISFLNHILKIDPARKIAIVEPKATMYQLAKAALEHGLIPLVVPEFKTITVGGAINGGGMESSSHKHGLFHETCPSFKVLLGNGEVVIASREENSDLYYGIACSYGSLGTIVQAEIQLAEAGKYIEIVYHPFDNAEQSLEYIMKRTLDISPPQFLDGLVFSDSCALVMEGSFVKEPPTGLVTGYEPLWFYQHAERIAKNRIVYKEYFTPLDYLFRYDQGAFWMGSYLFKPKLLRRFLLENLSGKKSIDRFNIREIDTFSTVTGNPPLLQSLFGRFLSSQRLYLFLHRVEKWVESTFIIQDFSISFEKCIFFYQEVKETAAIYPIWLCPLKKPEQIQLFSPHSQAPRAVHVMNIRSLWHA